MDLVKEGCLKLINYPPLLEKVVQITILGPLLFIGGFFLPPFHVHAEKSLEITAEDEGMVIRGQVDLVSLKEGFWVLAIESKENAFSVEAGLAQLLAYLLANPQSTSQPSFGLIVAGGSFLFIKLVCGNLNRYGRSRIFEISNPGNELYEVLAILKCLGRTVVTSR